jgi:hypothetical protein
MQRLIRARSWTIALAFMIAVLSVISEVAVGSEVAAAKCSLDYKLGFCDDGKRTELNVTQAADLSHRLLETKLTPLARKINSAYFDLSVDCTDIKLSTIQKIAHGYLTASPEVLFAEHKSWLRRLMEKISPHGWFDAFRNDLRSLSLTVELKRKDRHETLGSKPVIEYKRDPHEKPRDIYSTKCFDDAPLYKRIDSSYDLAATFNIVAVLAPQGPDMPPVAPLIAKLIPYKPGKIFATVVVFIWQNKQYVTHYFEDAPSVLPVSHDILKKHGGLSLEDGQFLYKEPAR